MIAPTIDRPALAIEGLRGGYGESPILRSVSLAVGPGEIFAILGKNGMGKTTLLKSVMGLLPVRGGSVTILGADVTRWPPYRITRLGVSYVPQEKAIFQDLSVEGNLRLALREPSDYRERLNTVARWFPVLQARQRQRAGTLSGGEQKMLLIGRALLTRPRLVLVDEITEGLQPAMITKLEEVLAEERRAHGMTIVLVEQNVGFALALADRYAVLKVGTVVETGRAADAGARETIERHLVI
jgi:ABC-type branched-subunit amino acid transport system ATPase component